MIQGLQIVRPVPDDLESSYLVFEEAITLAFQQEGIPQEAPQEVANKKRMILQSVEGESETVFLVAKLDGRVIGTASFGPCGHDVRVCANNDLGDIGELGSLYVLPEYQGQGVASSLIRVMLQDLHRQGVEPFCLDCGLKISQEKWLRKFGEPYKVVKDYWGPGSDHLVWLGNVVDYLGEAEGVGTGEQEGST